MNRRQILGLLAALPFAPKLSASPAAPLFRIERGDAGCWQTMNDVVVSEGTRHWPGNDIDDGEMHFTMRRAQYPEELIWVPVRAVYTYDGSDHVQWSGRIRTADVDGAFLRVAAYDPPYGLFGSSDGYNYVRVNMHPQHYPNHVVTSTTASDEHPAPKA